MHSYFSSNMMSHSYLVYAHILVIVGLGYISAMYMIFIIFVDDMLFSLTFDTFFAHFTSLN